MVANPPPYIVMITQKIATKKRDAADPARMRDQGVEHDPKGEENEVGRLAADLSRTATPTRSGPRC